MPILLKPQEVKRLLTSGVSPKRYWVSGVNDSGPEKNFLIPAVSSIGSLWNDFSKYGSKWSKSSGNSPKEKSSGTTPVSLKAGFALGSKIPTNIFPASSFKYKHEL